MCIICCFEILEHIDDYLQEILTIKNLLKPGGLVFFSTINRNFKSLVFAKFAAEYVLKLAPKGIHQFSKFIKPLELHKICLQNNLTLVNGSGMFYNPMTKQSKLIKSMDINYICLYKKDNELN